MVSGSESGHHRVRDGNESTTHQYQPYSRKRRCCEMADCQTYLVVKGCVKAYCTYITFNGGYIHTSTGHLSFWYLREGYHKLFYPNLGSPGFEV